VGCKMNCFWETGCELSLYPKHYSSEVGDCERDERVFCSEENELEQSPRIHFQAYLLHTPGLSFQQT
jgi:hypothetical protein